MLKTTTTTSRGNATGKAIWFPSAINITKPQSVRERSLIFCCITNHQNLQCKAITNDYYYFSWFGGLMSSTRTLTWGFLGCYGKMGDGLNRLDMLLKLIHYHS